MESHTWRSKTEEKCSCHLSSASCVSERESPLLLRTPEIVHSQLIGDLLHVGCVSAARCTSDLDKKTSTTVVTIFQRFSVLASVGLHARAYFVAEALHMLNRVTVGRLLRRKNNCFCISSLCGDNLVSTRHQRDQYERKS